jgi:hypothetical protein
MRFHVARIGFEHFEEQALSAHLVPLKYGGSAPSGSKTDDQDRRDRIFRD